MVLRTVRYGVACVAAFTMGAGGVLGCGSGGREDAPEEQSGSAAGEIAGVAVDAAGEVPIYEWDPTWPKQPLSDNWIVGGRGGRFQSMRWTISGSCIFRDQRCQRYRPGAAFRAPSVIEFDREGNLVQAWGGPRAEDLVPGGASDSRPPTLTWTPPTDYEWVKLGAQPLRRSPGPCVAGELQRLARPEVQSRRRAAAADWAGEGGGAGQQRHRCVCQPDRHCRRSGDQRGICGRRVRQPPGHCLRRRDGRLQAPLGSVRQRTG